MKNIMRHIKKIGTIVQARITSARLPGKALMEIQGKPVLWHVLERLRRSSKTGKIVLAIPDTKKNDILRDFAKSYGAVCVRGNENDVLARYMKAARLFSFDTIVRITGDCPLIDPEIIDEVIERHTSNMLADYTSNTLKRTFPRGLDVEIFSFRALARAHKEAKQPHEREHVTPYLYEHPKLFTLQNVSAKKLYRRPDIRITLDTKKDFLLIKKIYDYLYKPPHIFSARDVLKLLSEHPELLDINKNVRQKEIKKPT